MTVAGSGLYVATFVDALDTTQLALDLDLETHKTAMFTNTVTPNYTTDTAYGVAPYNANEVTGTAYVAGGVLLTGTTFLGAAGNGTFDAADVSWASSTIANARMALIYADALAGNNAIVGIDFTQDYSTNNGTFAIQWNASGIFIIDFVP